MIPTGLQNCYKIIVCITPNDLSPQEYTLLSTGNIIQVLPNKDRCGRTVVTIIGHGILDCSDDINPSTLVRYFVYYVSIRFYSFHSVLFYFTNHFIMFLSLSLLFTHTHTHTHTYTQ